MHAISEVEKLQREWMEADIVGDAFMLREGACSGTRSSVEILSPVCFSSLPAVVRRKTLPQFSNLSESHIKRRASDTQSKGHCFPQTAHFQHKNEIVGVHALCAPLQVLETLRDYLGSTALNLAIVGAMIGFERSK